MLYFNIQRVFALRGIERPYTWLVQNGFVAQTASNWAKNRIGYVRPEQMERLCLALNCTPNDLFEWREDNKTVVHDAHALRTLKREHKARSVADMTRDIPADKLEKLGEMLNALRNDGEDTNESKGTSNDI